MTEFDDTVGALTKKLEDLGVADNTIVILLSDNGAMKFSWPDGATSPFQGEKATTWEAGVRVPAIVKLAGRRRARHGGSTTSSPTTTGYRRFWPRLASRASRRSC